MSGIFDAPDQNVDQLVDTDPTETAEWQASFDAALEHAGPVRARYLMLKLLQRAHEKQIGLSTLRNTDYINTISPEHEPDFPGDEAIERRIRQYIRWNAAMLVHRAQRPGIGVGGHISTYASSASLYEVGFNHFFRGMDHPGGGDQIFFQGHASPGMYARAFLEGRLSENQLDGFRQEVSHAGGGLSSYPHPRLMPDFWQFPTVSMGIGPINAIYQARFNRYLQNRGIKDTSQQHVWAFLGDGEVDEVDTLGAIGLASRENLDNLTFVVNCNLQRLDGPVRGNGKIIQELESTFVGAGWNVIRSMVITKPLRLNLARMFVNSSLVAILVLQQWLPIGRMNRSGDSSAVAMITASSLLPIPLLWNLMESPQLFWQRQSRVGHWDLHLKVVTQLTK